MKTVLFVCTGNTCRSPMAEAILSDIVDRRPDLCGGILAKSAGMNASESSAMSMNAIMALKDLGIEPKRHRSAPMSKELAEEADIILTMEENHLNMLLRAWPEAEGKAHTLKGFAGLCGGSPRDCDVTDPFGASLKEYLACARELRVAIDKILMRIACEWNILK